jgi:tetratricopeptide (TPR) repeat protein
MRNTSKVASLILAVSLNVAGCSSSAVFTGRVQPNPIENQLLAEIALERGEYLVAAQQYLNVARQSKDPDYARRATETAWDYGFDAYALLAAERWVQLQPESAAAHGVLGRLYVRSGAIDKAWESFIVALGPPEQRLDHDYALLSGDFKSVPHNGLVLYERFNVEYPGTPGITRSLAELAAQSGDIGRAIEAARETISLRSDWSATRVWLARLLLLQGEKASAFEQMAFAQEMNPGLEFELEFVRLLAVAGELQTAVERLQRVSERYPEDLMVVMVGAEILMQSGEFERAEELYLDMVSRDICFSECLWRLANISFGRGDIEGGISLLGQIVGGERLVAARLAISQAYRVLGNEEMALSVLDAFATDYPKLGLQALQPAASILLSAGRYAEALDKIGRALDYRPWDADLWMFNGAALEQAGKLDKAVDAFRTAYELAPERAATLNAYGYTLIIATRKYREAMGYIDKAMQLEPGNPAYMDSKGWALFKLGRRSDALLWLEKAYEMMSDPEIAAHLGEVLWVKGERAEAEEIWRNALNDYPDNRTLNATLEQYLN